MSFSNAGASEKKSVNYESPLTRVVKKMLARLKREPTAQDVNDYLLEFASEPEARALWDETQRVGRDVTQEDVARSIKYLKSRGTVLGSAIYTAAQYQAVVDRTRPALDALKKALSKVKTDVVYVNLPGFSEPHVVTNKLDWNFSPPSNLALRALEQEDVLAREAANQFIYSGGAPAGFVERLQRQFYPTDLLKSQGYSTPYPDNTARIVAAVKELEDHLSPASPLTRAWNEMGAKAAAAEGKTVPAAITLLTACAIERAPMGDVFMRAAADAAPDVPPADYPERLTYYTLNPQASAGPGSQGQTQEEFETSSVNLANKVWEILRSKDGGKKLTEAVFGNKNLLSQPGAGSLRVLKTMLPKNKEEMMGIDALTAKTRPYFVASDVRKKLLTPVTKAVSDFMLMAWENSSSRNIYKLGLIKAHEKLSKIVMQCKQPELFNASDDGYLVIPTQGSFLVYDKDIKQFDLNHPRVAERVVQGYFAYYFSQLPETWRTLISLEIRANYYPDLVVDGAYTYPASGGNHSGGPFNTPSNVIVSTAAGEFAMELARAEFRKRKAEPAADPEGFIAAMDKYFNVLGLSTKTGEGQEWKPGGPFTAPILGMRLINVTINRCEFTGVSVPRDYEDGRSERARVMSVWPGIPLSAKEDDRQFHELAAALGVLASGGVMDKVVLEINRQKIMTGLGALRVKRHTLATIDKEVHKVLHRYMEDRIYELYRDPFIEGLMKGEFDKPHILQERWARLCTGESGVPLEIRELPEMQEAPKDDLSAFETAAELFAPMPLDKKNWSFPPEERKSPLPPIGPGRELPNPEPREAQEPVDMSLLEAIRKSKGASKGAPKKKVRSIQDILRGLKRHRKYFSYLSVASHASKKVWPRRAGLASELAREANISVEDFLTILGRTQTTTGALFPAGDKAEVPQGPFILPEPVQERWLAKRGILGEAVWDGKSMPTIEINFRELEYNSVKKFQDGGLAGHDVPDRLWEGDYPVIINYREPPNPVRDSKIMTLSFYIAIPKFLWVEAGMHRLLPAGPMSDPAEYKQWTALLNDAIGVPGKSDNEKIADALKALEDLDLAQRGEPDEDPAEAQPPVEPPAIQVEDVSHPSNPPQSTGAVTLPKADAQA